MMAKFPRLICLFLMTLLATFRNSEGGCSEQGVTVVHMCQSSQGTNAAIFLDAQTLLAHNEECSCEMVPTQRSNLKIYPVSGSLIPDCDVKVWFLERSNLHHIVTCDLRDISEKEVQANIVIDATMQTNMTGSIDACIYMAVDQGELEVKCTTKETLQKSPNSTTPSTQSPSGPSPSTPSPSKTSPSKTSPSTPSPSGPSLSTPSPSKTSPSKTSPSTPSPSKPSPSKKSLSTPSASTPSPSPTNQSTTNHSTKNHSTTNPPSPPQTVPTTTTFPVPEVAGGVAAGILLVSLLLVCLTCCAGSSTSRNADEESLKSHESESPKEEMQETGEDEHAYDNVLCHTSQKDETGKDGSDKSLTPTVSENSTHDDSATNEGLYLSVY